MFRQRAIDRLLTNSARLLGKNSEAGCRYCRSGVCAFFEAAKRSAVPCTRRLPHVCSRRQTRRLPHVSSSPRWRLPSRAHHGTHRLLVENRGFPGICTQEGSHFLRLVFLDRMLKQFDNLVKGRNDATIVLLNDALGSLRQIRTGQGGQSG